MAYSANAMQESYNPTDEQCMRVARYIQWGKLDEKHELNKNKFLECSHPAAQKVKQFLSTIDEDVHQAIQFISSISTISLNNLYSQRQNHTSNVRLLADELSQSNIFVGIACNKDVFAAMCHASLPEKYEDRAGFFSEKSNSQVREVNSEDRPAYPVLSQKEMVKKLQTFPLAKALYVFTFVDIPQCPLSKIKYDRELINDSSFKDLTETRVVPRMDYQWTYEDCKNLTTQQMAYLDASVHGLNNTDWENDNRLVITDEVMHVFNFKKNKNDTNPVQDFILNNEKYGNQRIKPDITPSTPWENIRNKFLCIVPHGLAMIIPDLIQSQTNGVYDSAKGIAICAAGSFCFGQFVYPIIDSYNSDVCKFSKWYGPKNYKKTRVGREFVWISLISSLANVIAQRYLSWSATPWKILGGGIHIVRAFLSCIVLINIEDFYNKSPYRRHLNEKGVSFTLKDLANGPKFNPK
jgi:hypothetical protein